MAPLKVIHESYQHLKETDFFFFFFKSTEEKKTHETI